jgi:hypothetical protein
MLRIVLASALALALAGATAFAQGVPPGGGIGGSTAIGSGLGGVTGTGPSWPGGTNQAPQPSINSVPPGGYASPAPPSTYGAPRPSFTAPSTGAPSAYRQPNEPYAGTNPRPPAMIPLQFPERPNGSLVFLKGCWRSDIFPFGQQRGTLTWCFDDRGGGRYLYTRTDGTTFFCHAQAQAEWNAASLRLRSLKMTCDDGSTNAPAALTCRDGSDGALCTRDGETSAMRLYRVR